MGVREFHCLRLLAPPLLGCVLIWKPNRGRAHLQAYLRHWRDSFPHSRGTESPGFPLAAGGAVLSCHRLSTVPWPVGL